MADNQTSLTMTSLNISFNKLQLHLFYAFAEGFCKQRPAKDFYLYHNENDTDYILSLIHDVPGGDLTEVMSHPISRGVSQMNDIRPGVIVNHISMEADKFLEKVNEYLSGLPSAN